MAHQTETQWTIYPLDTQSKIYQLDTQSKMYSLDTQSKIYQLDTQSISIHLTHSHRESSNGLDTQSISIHLTHSHWESSNGLHLAWCYIFFVIPPLPPKCHNPKLLVSRELTKLVKHHNLDIYLIYTTTLWNLHP